MICECILGNLHDGSLKLASDEKIELLPITWKDLACRFLRVKTEAGRDVGLLLPADARLHHGDVVHHSPGLTIAVELVPTDVLVIEPRANIDLTTTAYLLGDLHCPLQIVDGTLIVPAEDALASLLLRLQLTARPARMRFAPIDRGPLGQWTVAIP